MVSISLSLNVLPQLATSRIATDVVRGQFVLVTNYFVVLGKGRQRLPAPMGNPFGIALKHAWTEWAAKQGVSETIAAALYLISENRKAEEVVDKLTPGELEQVMVQSAFVFFAPERDLSVDLRDWQPSANAKGAVPRMTRDKANKSLPRARAAGPIVYLSWPIN